MVSSLVNWRPKRFPSGAAQSRPERVVVHVTGRATYLNAKKQQLSPLVHLGINNFLVPGGGRRAHYAVDPWGSVGCYAPENQRPMAQGWNTYKTAYKGYTGRDGVKRGLAAGQLVIPAWWQKAWALLQDPRDLLQPKADSPNYRAVAVEFILFDNQYLLTEAQYATGFMLLADICSRNDIPLDPKHVYGHEDVDPWGRGDAAGGWDPGAARAQPRVGWGGLLGQPWLDASALVLPTPEKPPWAALPATGSAP